MPFALSNDKLFIVNSLYIRTLYGTFRNKLLIRNWHNNCLTFNSRMRFSNEPA